MESKAVAFIISNEWANSPIYGTHNGYVAVPPTNKYHGKSYWDKESVIQETKSLMEQLIDEQGNAITSYRLTYKST